MSDENNSKQKAKQESRKTSRGRRRSGWISVAAVLIFLFVFYRLITPNVGSGPASPLTSSLNNVKNLGLGQHNHADQHEGLFATPTLYNKDGLPVHGWFTQLLPMLDNTALYEAIDLSVPWNHPDNQEYSKVKIEVSLSPGLDEEENSDGYPLLHYTLNTRLFPNNESFTADYVTQADGLANTILMGEIQEGLPAWAEPGSARDPAMGLRPGPNTMGVSVWGGRTAFGFADGSAKMLNNNIDPVILKALSTPDGGEELPEDW